MKVLETTTLFLVEPTDDGEETSGAGRSEDEIDTHVIRRAGPQLLLASVVMVAARDGSSGKPSLVNMLKGGRV